jgi:hypothetical protein
MKPFKSAEQAQRFLSTHDHINNLFRLRRDHDSPLESVTSKRGLRIDHILTSPELAPRQFCGWP